MKCRILRLLIPLAVALVAGCDNDDRFAQLASQTAETAKRLVEADAKSRQELTALQRDLQAEQTNIGRQRDQLESERRTIAGQRHRDPIIAAVLTDLGLVLACLVPLVVCLYLLRTDHCQPTANAELAELLTQEIVSETPVLLPPPSPDRAITRDSGPNLALPGGGAPETADS
jgi:predicted PurR-regulated permease PerM